jgi:hypothetical protein
LPKLIAQGVNAQGGFAEYVVTSSGRCFDVDDLDPETAVSPEPVACVVHGLDVFDTFGIAQSLSRQIATHGPDERRHARYMAEYELFLEAYQRLEPWFDKLWRRPSGVDALSW